ncbi:KH domain-containing protein [Agrococcus sp. DT81.2]|uniref:DUF4258 domain-containing protein n=1 Tax=Agrococcus sp. DT81.2 TaxID=3393414 RepID=UPI003CE54181
MEIAIAVAFALVILGGLAALLLRGRPKPRSLPIVYTAHARDRMSQRRVNETQVERVVAAPQRTKYDPDEDSFRLERDIGAETLKVWVVAPWPAKEQVVIKSVAWHSSIHFSIAPDAIGRVVGRSGERIQAIEHRTRTRVSIDGGGSVRITSGSRSDAEAARSEIEAAARTTRVAVGDHWTAAVSKHLPHGVIVESSDGSSGFVHVSELRSLAGGKRIDDLSSVAPMGRVLKVRVHEIREGRVRLRLGGSRQP